MLNVISGLLGTGAAAGGGTSYESISTVTVGAGGSATITFSSIPSTYKHLQIRAFGKSNATSVPNDAIQWYINGASTLANEVTHVLTGNGSTATASARTTNGGDGCGWVGRNGNWGGSVIDILDYADTNKYKTFRGLGGSDANGSGNIYFGSLLWLSTSAITSLTLDPNGNTWSQYSSIALYGIKG